MYVKRHDNWFLLSLEKTPDIIRYIMYKKQDTVFHHMS